MLIPILSSGRKCFLKVKKYRFVATRYEKLAKNYKVWLFWHFLLGGYLCGLIDYVQQRSTRSRLAHNKYSSNYSLAMAIKADVNQWFDDILSLKTTPIDSPPPLFFSPKGRTLDNTYDLYIRSDV